MKDFAMLFFLFETLFLENFASQNIAQNLFVQSDCRMLWLLVFLEGMYKCFWFSAWRYSPAKGSVWEYYFWLDMSRHAQSRPDLSRRVKSVFGWSREIARSKIVENERSFNSLANKAVFSTV